MNADPEVAATLSRALTRTESDAFADAIERHWREDGYGLWALDRLEDGSSSASPGSRCPASRSACDWRDAWGFGCATEAARAAPAFAFETLQLEDLISLTAAVNLRSRAVMERIGMHHDPSSDCANPRLPADHPLAAHVTYRISRAEWRVSR